LIRKLSGNLKRCQVDGIAIQKVEATPEVIQQFKKMGDPDEENISCR
jgi:hypothetical protein